jgi:hypothetical protein
MTLAPDDQSCAQCRYYLGEDDGFCHRNPPSIWLPTAEYGQPDSMRRITAQWPPVSADDWCGEFAKLQVTPMQKAARPKDETL